MSKIIFNLKVLVWFFITLFSGAMAAVDESFSKRKTAVHMAFEHGNGFVVALSRITSGAVNYVKSAGKALQFSIGSMFVGRKAAILASLTLIFTVLCLFHPGVASGSIVMFAVGDVAITGSSPLGMAGLTPGQAAVKKAAFDNRLRIKSVQDDFLNPAIRGLYDPNTKETNKSSIYYEVKAMGDRQANNITVTMKLPLSGAGTFAANRLVGGEEQAITKTSKLYRGMVRKAVDVPGYGPMKLDMEYLNLWEEHENGLALWAKEEKALQLRQAPLEGFGENLWYGDTAATCANVPLNKNIFIAGLTAQQNERLTYSTDPSTYTQNIVEQMLNSGGGSLTPVKGQTLDQSVLSNLEAWLTTTGRQIRPIPLASAPNGWGWIMSISDWDAIYLGDPAWTSSNLGSFFKDMNRLADKDKVMWRNPIGMYKHIMFIVDMRLATVLPGGSSAGSYSITTGYLRPGNNEHRNLSNPNIRNACTIWGEGAIWDWQLTKGPEFVKQFDDYEFFKGTGIYDVYGVGSPIFNPSADGTGALDNTIIQDSSAIVLTSRPGYNSNTVAV